MKRKREEEGEYDYVIVGGGLAGVTAALAIVAENPGCKVLILEAGDKLFSGASGVQPGRSTVAAVHYPDLATGKRVMEGCVEFYWHVHNHILPLMEFNEKSQSWEKKEDNIARLFHIDCRTHYDVDAESLKTVNENLPELQKHMEGILDAMPSDKRKFYSLLFPDLAEVATLLPEDRQRALFGARLESSADVKTFATSELPVRASKLNEELADKIEKNPRCKNITVKVGAKVEKITPRENGGYDIQYENQGKKNTVSAKKHVFLCAWDHNEELGKKVSNGFNHSEGGCSQSTSLPSANPGERTFMRFKIAGRFRIDMTKLDEKQRKLIHHRRSFMRLYKLADGLMMTPDSEEEGYSFVTASEETNVLYNVGGGWHQYQDYEPKLSEAEIARLVDHGEIPERLQEMVTDKLLRKLEKKMPALKGQIHRVPGCDGVRKGVVIADGAPDLTAKGGWNRRCIDEMRTVEDGVTAIRAIKALGSQSKIFAYVKGVVNEVLSTQETPPHRGLVACPRGRIPPSLRLPPSPTEVHGAQYSLFRRIASPTSMPPPVTAFTGRSCR